MSYNHVQTLSEAQEIIFSIHVCTLIFAQQQMLRLFKALSGMAYIQSLCRNAVLGNKYWHRK